MCAFMPPFVPNAFINVLPDHVVVDIVQRHTVSAAITPTMARPYLARQFRNEASGESYNREMVQDTRRLFDAYQDHGSKAWEGEPDIERRELAATWPCLLGGKPEKLTICLPLTTKLVPATRMLPQMEKLRDDAIKGNDAQLLPGPPFVRVETTMVPAPAPIERMTLDAKVNEPMTITTHPKARNVLDDIRDDIARAEDRAFLHGTSPVKKPKPGDVILYADPHNQKEKAKWTTTI